jgi:UDP-GlcNAc:undecaprenyl-phosphate GlcNAc-1-phosphate transferase
LGISVLADDFRNLRARFKLIVQLGCALLVAGMGFTFGRVYLPLGIGMVPLGILDIPLTVLWIVGITNAINMIDGMDGLAGGISLIATITFGLTYLELGEPYSALLAFALAGAVAGDLFFNFPPASSWEIPGRICSVSCWRCCHFSTAGTSPWRWDRSTLSP